jgi:hypothetical protein
MNKKLKLLVLLTVLSMFALGLPAQASPVKMCCIAGEYSGSHTSDASLGCPPSVTETFTMSLKQGIGCNTNIWGKITDAAGVVNTFNGYLTRGPRGCCVIHGKFGTPGHVTKFTGTICKIMIMGAWKWVVKDGTAAEEYSGVGCKHTSTWKMRQI